MFSCPATEDFFRARLDQMIDLRHPLCVLSSRMPWQQIEASVSHLFMRKARAAVAMPDLDLFGEAPVVTGRVSTAGRPRVPLRVMIALQPQMVAAHDCQEGCDLLEIPFFATAGSAAYTSHTGLAGCNSVSKTLDAHARTVKDLGTCPATTGYGRVLNKSGPTTDRSSPPRVLRHWRRLVNGVRHSCTGTTSNTSTAAFATCRRSSVIPGKTTPFWPPVMCCTPRPSSAIRHVGHAIHVTGAPSGRSPLTPNVIALLRST